MQDTELSGRPSWPLYCQLCPLKIKTCPPRPLALLASTAMQKSGLEHDTESTALAWEPMVCGELHVLPL